MERRPSKLQILIVDDSSADALLLKNLLSQGDAYDCVLTGTLTQALKYLAQHTFDVALVDLHLPDSYGPATITAISRAYPTLPLVVVTGDLSPGAEIDSVTAGAAGFILKKDLTVEDLQTEIRVAMTRHSRTAVSNKTAQEARKGPSSSVQADALQHVFAAQVKNLESGIADAISDSLAQEIHKLHSVVQSEMHPLAGDVAEIKATLRVIQSTVDGHSRILTGGSTPEKGLLHKVILVGQDIKKCQDNLASRSEAAAAIGVEKTKGRAAVQIALITMLGAAISALTSAWVATQVTPPAQAAPAQSTDSR